MFVFFIVGFLELFATLHFLIVSFPNPGTYAQSQLFLRQFFITCRLEQNRKKIPRFWLKDLQKYKNIKAYVKDFFWDRMEKNSV